MDKIELIDNILEYCYFDEMTFLFLYYNISILGSKEHGYYDGVRFRKLVKEQKIKQYQIAKEVYSYQTEDKSGNSSDAFKKVYKHIRQIGIPYIIENKEGDGVEYVTNPNIVDELALKKLIREARKSDKYKNYCFKQITSICSRVDFIIDYLNTYTKLFFDYSVWNKEDVRNCLIEEYVRMEDLEKLYELLINDNWKEYFIYPKPVEIYEQFLDDTEVNNLIFIEKNINVIMEHLDMIYSVYEHIKFIDEKNLENILYHLKRKRTIVHDNVIYKTAYSTICSNDDEYEFRYNIIHNILRDIDEDICNKIIWIFSDMNSIKWDIIRHIFRTYSSPDSKPVENFIEKIYTEFT